MTNADPSSRSVSRPDATAPPVFPGVPEANKHHPLTLPLLGLVLLSFIPALILTLQRVAYEQAQKTTALVMDYPALVTQARRYGLEPQALLDKYKALGVNGVALYEDTIASLE